MKNALILHGTGGDHNENWFPWLHKQLEENGYKVWSPDLPEADTPNIQRYNKFLLSENNWTFDQDSILVGHSSGAVAILGLLQALPEGAKVDTCYLVGAFKNDLGWDSLSGLFEEPFDFNDIQSKADKFVFIHSDNDPYCPLDHAEYLAEQLDAELIVKEGQQHFSVSTFGEAYTEFPFLLELIEQRNKE